MLRSQQNITTGLAKKFINILQKNSNEFFWPNQYTTENYLAAANLGSSLQSCLDPQIGWIGYKLYLLDLKQSVTFIPM